MKSITIPTHNNPFTVNINNKEYTYKGGETIEVPDEVAEAIEDALELVPKPKRYLSRLAMRVQGSIESIDEGDLEGCESISAHAFYLCEKLRIVKLPKSVVSIGERAFHTCTKLEKVIIPDDSNLETIGDYAFGYNYVLSNINLPKTLKTIGESSFSYCRGLSKVTLKATTPPTIQANTFGSVPTTCVFEVPAESVETYKSAPNWSAFANQIVAIEE